MKKCIFVSVFLSFFVFAVFPAKAKIYSETKELAVQASLLRPLTNEEIASFPDKTFSEKWDFILKYYTENKLHNATDEAIFNELIKLNPQLATTFIKTYKNVSKNLTSFKKIYAQVVENINEEIQKQHPDKPEYLIDPDNFASLKNLSHVTEINTSTFDYLISLSDTASYSYTKEGDFGYFRLLSCARKPGTTEILMGAEINLKDDFVILHQKEGMDLSPITLDFSSSENVEKVHMYYPVPKELMLKDRKSTIYEGNVVFPFIFSIKDNQEPVVFSSHLSFNRCHKKTGECQPFSTPVATQEFEKELSVETKSCYPLRNIKSLIPEFDRTNLDILKTSLRKTEQGTFLFVLAKSNVFSSITPRLIISNNSGLFFEKPFVNIKNSQILYRAKLLNPEQISFPTTLKLSLTFDNRAFEKTVTFEGTASSFQLFDTSFFDFIKTFFTGMKFLFFTPFLLVFFLLFYKSIFTASLRRKEKEAFTGIGAGYLLFLMIALPVLTYFPAVFLSGKQFEIPWMNGIFALIFLSVPFWIFKFINSENVNPFDFIEKNPEKGTVYTFFLLTFVSLSALMISPQIPLFYTLYNSLQTQSFWGVIVFSVGALWPFAVFLWVTRYLRYKEIKLSPKAKLIFCAPCIFQALLLSLLLGFQSAGIVFLIWMIFTVSLVLLVAYIPMERLKQVSAFVLVAIISLSYIPFSERISDKEIFSTEKLQNALKDDKFVYLNVSSPGCLTCHYNQLIFNFFKKDNAFYRDRLVGMKVNLAENKYMHDFLKDIETVSVPTNMLFSQKKKNGIIMPSILSNEALILLLPKMDLEEN